jgi:predicted O-methyltransferase YrrM
MRPVVHDVLTDSQAGTSYGVSTIYLALAARSNAIITGVDPLVIGTEHELAKVAQAHTYWREAGVDGIIDLREGDLRETLAREIPTVDLLLLDSEWRGWCE